MNKLTGLSRLERALEFRGEEDSGTGGRGNCCVGNLSAVP